MAGENVGKQGDLRVRKTKRAIKRAVVELSREAPGEKLTVKRVVERAEINKSTFYFHYGCIEDLLDEMERDLLDDVAQKSAGMRDLLKDDPETFLTYFSDYIYSRSFFKAKVPISMKADLLAEALGSENEGYAGEDAVMELVLFGIWGTAIRSDKEDFDRRIPSLASFIQAGFACLNG